MRIVIPKTEGCCIMRPSSKTLLSLAPPASVKGMRVFDREAFKREISAPVLKIAKPITRLVVARIRNHLLKLDNFKPVQSASEDDDIQSIYLNPDSVSSFESLSSSDRSALSELRVTEANFEFSRLTLTYDNWKLDQILRSILPDEKTFSSYSIIGHIVHVNLREHLYPYKNVIGRVLLDKIKSCRTVVNKIDAIDSRFRNFQMELLAGDADYKTTVKESNCKFEFDFSEVYWNSRLSTERDRIISSLGQAHIVFDVFAGVGPFSIPAARNKGCYVSANDLNPACCVWLERNRRLNRIEANTLRISNKDGFQFVRENVKTELIDSIKNNQFATDTRVHVIMNLPSLSHTFLPAFLGLMNDDIEIDSFPQQLLPILHVYCFVKNETADYAVRLIERSLNADISNDDSVLEICNVRKVAPNKEMIRVSFRLSRNLLFRNSSDGNDRININDNNDDGSNNKRSLENDHDDCENSVSGKKLC